VAVKPEQLEISALHILHVFKIDWAQKTIFHEGAAIEKKMPYDVIHRIKGNTEGQPNSNKYGQIWTHNGSVQQLFSNPGYLTQSGLWRQCIS
jgi:hypothetical protein